MFLILRIEIIRSKFSEQYVIKLKVRNRNICGDFPNSWKLNTLLNIQCFKKEVKGKLENILIWRKIKPVCQKLWDAAKAMPRGKSIASNVYIKKEEMFQINGLSFHLTKTSKRQDFHMAERGTQQILLQKEKKEKRNWTQLFNNNNNNNFRALINQKYITN